MARLVQRTLFQWSVYKIHVNAQYRTLKQLKGRFEVVLKRTRGMKRILIILVLPLLTVEGTSLERHQIQKVLEMFIFINCNIITC